MSATLTQLDSQPDLVERVHRALADAISTGQLPPLARITQEDVARQLAVSRQPVLQALQLLERGRKAARGRDVQAMIDADLAFHRAVYAASGNPLIEQSALVHWQHIRRAMGASLQHSGLRETVWDEHEAIATAIAAGRAGEAERLMAGHGQRASEHIARRLGAATKGDAA
jgi:DNA-binding GntR family transcriptional regulator